MKRADGFVITHYFKSILAENVKESILLVAELVIILQVSGSFIFTSYRQRLEKLLTHLKQLYSDMSNCLDLLCIDWTGRGPFFLKLSSILQLYILSQPIIVSTKDRNLQVFRDTIMFRRITELNNPS